MNKLNKDQIQKIVLSGLLMVGLIYCYFAFLIDPLGQADSSNATAIEQLDSDLAKARSAVKRGSTVQAQAHTAVETLAQANDMIPEGAPIAWFPPRMNAFFSRHNIKGVVVRSNSIDSANDPVMRDFKNATWTVEVPQIGASQLGITLAGLENEEKLLEVTRLQIASVADAPEKQRVSLNLLTLLK